MNVLLSATDAMTRKLMERFYRNLFEDKLSQLEALRETQLWVLKDPSVVTVADGDRGPVRLLKDPSIDAENQRPSQKNSPYYWAPFVLSGDCR